MGYVVARTFALEITFLGPRPEQPCGLPQSVADGSVAASLAFPLRVQAGPSRSANPATGLGSRRGKPHLHLPQEPRKARRGGET